MGSNPGYLFKSFLLYMPAYLCQNWLRHTQLNVGEKEQLLCFLYLTQIFSRGRPHLTKQASHSECESEICLPSLSIYYALCVHKLTLSLGNFKTSDSGSTATIFFMCIRCSPNTKNV